MSEHYRIIWVESFLGPDRGDKGNIRIRPFPDQGYSELLRVECCKKMRENYPIGSVFKIKVKLVSREDGSDFLYSYHGWPYEVRP